MKLNISYILILIICVSLSNMALACEKLKYKPTRSGDNIVRVTATLTEDNLNCGTSVTADIRKKILKKGLQTDQAGHLIAKVLGGYGSVISNVVPMSESVNKGRYKQAENKVHKCMKDKGGWAKLDIRVKYKNRSLPNRPTSFIYNAELEKCPGFTMNISNPS